MLGGSAIFFIVSPRSIIRCVSIPAFYLAALPQGQNPLHSSEEVAESLWIAPKAALDRGQAGNFPMMPPTIAVLRTLAAHDSWNSLCKAFQLVILNRSTNR